MIKAYLFNSSVIGKAHDLDATPRMADLTHCVDLQNPGYNQTSYRTVLALVAFISKWCKI